MTAKPLPDKKKDKFYKKGDLSSHEENNEEKITSLFWGIRDEVEIKNLLYSFENTSLISFDKTTRIESFQTIIDENRYIFQNFGENDVRYIILPPRSRKRERVLERYDQDHTSLPEIPIEKANVLLMGMCKKILDSVMEDMKKSSLEEEFQKVKNRIDTILEDIFLHSQEVSPSDFRNNLKGLTDIYDNPKLRREGNDSLRRMLRLSMLLRSYVEGGYYPLIFLTPKSRSQGIILIDESVKVVGGHFRRDAPLMFKMFGNFGFLYEIEPIPYVYCSYGVVTPEGLIMKDIHFDFDEPWAECYNNRKNEYFNSDYFHLTLNEKKSENMSRCERKIINISFGLSNEGFSFGTLSILIAMLWILVLFPAWSNFISFLIPDYIIRASFIPILEISFPLIVAIALFAFGKKILRDFIAAQIFLLVVIFLLEFIFIFL